MSEVTTSIPDDLLLIAAASADWQQVALNGGPPCFHFERGEMRFCLRAERWEGHANSKDFHEFVSLRSLFTRIASLESSNRALTEENARLKAPVTNEEGEDAGLEEL